MALNIFNMDKHMMSSLIDVNMVDGIHTHPISCADVEPTFDQIFEEELMLLNELVHIDFMNNETFASVILLTSKVLRICL